MEKNLLKNVYLFKGLSSEQLEIINEISKLQVYNIGEEIFEQGDAATAFYVIKFGGVRIQQKTQVGDLIEVASLGTGSHFGEMAFLDGEKRSASAQAMEKSEIVILDYQSLQKLIEKNTEIAVHFYRGLANFLCGRLRLTTNDLSFAREKNLSHF
jgi:CRP-like cAMP-binding protein